MTYGDPQYPHGGQPYGSTPGGPPPGPPSGPYGPPAGPPGANPYGQQPSGPYGQPGGPPGANPYGQPPADPYGQPPADPFGAPAVDPFNQQPSSVPPYGQPSSGPPMSAQPMGGSPMSGPPGPVDPYGFGGAPPPPPPKSGSRVWLAVLGGVVVLAVLAACGIGGYFLLQEDKDQKPTAGSSSSAAPDDSPSKSDDPEPSESEGDDDVDISSRETDPEPLTVDELFGNPTVDVPTGKYPVVKTEVLTTCKNAVTGPSLGPKLTSLGCNQVVRAAINSPGNRYGITAGVFNLAEDNGSEVTTVIKAQKGDAFIGLVGTGASAVINQATSMMYWQPIGHYLVYVVIVRGDRKPATTSDAAIKQIGNDILITHLGTLLQKREQ